MISSLPLAFLDLETTGCSPSRDRIIEIGVCFSDHGRPSGEWQRLVNPGRPISSFIRNYTGIDDTMVAGAEPFAALGDELRRHLAGRIVVAHNATFDLGFLRAEFARCGEDFAAPHLCTVKLSRRLSPGERRHGLDALIARHGLACGGRHRALADAEVLRDYLLRIVPTAPAAVVARAVDEQLAPAVKSLTRGRRAVIT